MGPFPLFKMYSFRLILLPSACTHGQQPSFEIQYQQSHCLPLHLFSSNYDLVYILDFGKNLFLDIFLTMFRDNTNHAHFSFQKQLHVILLHLNELAFLKSLSKMKCTFLMG